MSDQLFVGNVDRAHFIVTLELEGWRVRAHFRHEYDPDRALRESEYSGLTLAEVLDVVEGTLAGAPVVI